MTASPQPVQSQLLQRTIATLGRHHVGAVAGILDVAGGEPLIAGTGRLRAAGGPAPDADTTFEIGSITKTFTALALAQAVVAGRLSLDHPLATCCQRVQLSRPGMVSRSPWSTWRGTLQVCHVRHNVWGCGRSGPLVREERIRTHQSARRSCLGS